MHCKFVIMLYYVALRHYKMMTIPLVLLLITKHFAWKVMMCHVGLHLVLYDSCMMCIKHDTSMVIGSNYAVLCGCPLLYIIYVDSFKVVQCRAADTPEISLVPPFLSSLSVPCRPPGSSHTELDEAFSHERLWRHTSVSSAQWTDANVPLKDKRETTECDETIAATSHSNSLSHFRASRHRCACYVSARGLANQRRSSGTVCS